jgi:hypothetical protein
MVRTTLAQERPRGHFRYFVAKPDIVAAQQIPQIDGAR